jgi:hypothetical protein
MTERTVTIRLGIQDEIGNRLLELRKQRDALLTKSTINLKVNAEGMSVPEGHLPRLGLSLPEPSGIYQPWAKPSAPER